MYSTSEKTNYKYPSFVFQEENSISNEYREPVLKDSLFPPNHEQESDIDDEDSLSIYKISNPKDDKILEDPKEGTFKEIRIQKEKKIVSSQKIDENQIKEKTFLSKKRNGLETFPEAIPEKKKMNQSKEVDDNESKKIKFITVKVTSKKKETSKNEEKKVQKEKNPLKKWKLSSTTL